MMKSLENDYWPVELGIRCSTGLLCLCAKQRLSNKDWSIWSGCGCKLDGGGTVGSKETPASHETTKCLHIYGVSWKMVVETQYSSAEVWFHPGIHQWWRGRSSFRTFSIWNPLLIYRMWPKPWKTKPGPQERSLFRYAAKKKTAWEFPSRRKISWIHTVHMFVSFNQLFPTLQTVRCEALSGLWRALCGTEPEEPTFPIHLPSGYD